MQCYREGVVYLARCRRCHLQQMEEGKQEQEVVEEVYLGESSRSVVTRAREHHANYQVAMKKVAREGSLPRVRVSRPGGQEEEEVSSWMADHTVTCHQGEVSPELMDDYDFMVIGSWIKPLQRQVEEAVRIRNAMTKGFLWLGKGKRRRKLLVNKRILNRKLENFSPCFLTMGGGDRQAD